jgi:hypothetical protein
MRIADMRELPVGPDLTPFWAARFSGERCDYSTLKSAKESSSG